MFLNKGDKGLPDEPVKDPRITQDSIFLSYAWGDPDETGESREAIVDRLHDTLIARGLKVVRDKKDNGYKKHIQTFMDQIGQGQIIIVVISDKYLKSPNCMYELTQIYRNDKFGSRVFPIYLSDAKIFDVKDRLRLVIHWKNEIKEMEDLVAEAGISNLSLDGSIKYFFDFHDAIGKNLDKIATMLADWNALTPKLLEENNFEILMAAIEERIAEIKA